MLNKKGSIPVRATDDTKEGIDSTRWTVNGKIKAIRSSTGNIITIAGTGTAGYRGDGAAANLARLTQS